MGTRSSVCEHAAGLADQHISNQSGRVYDLITEGRRDWKDGKTGELRKYAWCGDFVTYVLQLAGVADKAALNRVSVNGVWKPGMNISMLLTRARTLGACYEGSQAYQRLQANRPGDIVIINNPNGGHVGVLASVIDGTTFSTWDGNGPGAQTGHNVRSLLKGAALSAVINVDVWDAILATTNPARRAPAPKPVGRGDASDPLNIILNAIERIADSPVVQHLEHCPTDDAFGVGELGLINIH